MATTHFLKIDISISVIDFAVAMYEEILKVSLFYTYGQGLKRRKELHVCAKGCRCLLSTISLRNEEELQGVEVLHFCLQQRVRSC